MSHGNGCQKNASPGQVEHKNIYTISTCDQNRKLVDFSECVVPDGSNFVSHPVDYCVPGVEIQSLYNNNQMAV